MALNCGWIYTNSAYLAYTAGAGNITVTTADANYGKANLVDYFIDLPMRFTATTGTILIDCTAPHNITFCWIGQHNFSSGVTLTLTAGSTSACSDFSTTIAYASQNTYKIFAQQGYRYWKLTVDDSGRSSGYPEMCELIIGAFAQFSAMFSYGWQKGRAFDNITHQMEFGRRASYDRYQVQKRQFSFINRTATLDSEIETLFSTAKGDRYPIVIVPDTSVNFSLFGYLVGEYASTNVESYPLILQSTGFGFVEASAGKVVA